MTKIKLKTETDEVTLAEMCETFIHYKQVNNLSPQSIKYYKGCYSNFFEYYDGNNLCSTLSVDIFYDFVTYLRNRNPNIRDITINSYLRGLRAIFYYGMERGYVPQFKIRMIRAEKTLKNPYTDEELAILLKKPDIQKCSFVEYRTWVMTNYFIGTGNRASTAINLLIEDIRFSENQIFMKKTKSRRQQIIPLSLSLSKILKEYLSYRKGSPQDYLFCTENGLQLSLRGLETSVKNYNNKRGIEKTSIHLFRHKFAKDWIINGGDMFRLQNILGHSDLTIVKEYVNMYANDLQVQFNEFNPLERHLKNIEGQKIRLK